MATQDLSSWTPRSHPPKTTLSGTHVVVESFNFLKHAEGMCNLVFAPDTPQRFRYLFDNPPKTRQDAKNFLQNRAEREPFYAIIDKLSNKIVGNMGLHETNQEHGRTELGVYFGADLARKPGATEAVYLLLKHVFDDLKYRR